MANLPALDGLVNAPEVRPLPSIGVTRLPRYYEPLRHPRRPGLSLAGVRLGHAPTAGVSRVAPISLCRHAVAITPVEPQAGVLSLPMKPVTAAFPIPLLGRLPHYAFRGLLGVHSGYGLSARGVAHGDPFHRRLRQYRCLHCRFDCYRLERPLAGWELHPLKIDTFPRRTKGTHLFS